MLAEELKRRGWTSADLARRRKDDPEKLRIARRLRQETSMTLPWITGQLNMGAAGTPANLLRHSERTRSMRLCRTLYDPFMPSLKRARVDFWIIGLVLTLAFILFIGRDSKSKAGPRITSFSHLYQIGIAIKDYTDANGGRPKQLSDLVPRYIPLDQMSIFFVIDRYASGPSLPPDWASHPSCIDQYASYVYSGANSKRAVLAYEKVDLWRPGVSHPNEVAVLFTDFHVQYLPALILQKWIGPKSGKDLK